MPKNDCHNGCLDDIDLDFVEREATPKLSMKLSIQLHLAGLSLSNTVLFLEVFGVDRVRSTVHNWVHKADLQRESGRCPNHVAVDKTVIKFDDEQYWLYAAVDPDSNDLLHTKLESTRKKRDRRSVFGGIREKHDVNDAIFLVDEAVPLHRACNKHDLDFRYERHVNRNSIERVFCEVKRRTTGYQTVLATLKQKL